MFTKNTKKKKTFCHGDLTVDNILCNKDKIRFIDWELSGLSEEIWGFDLVYLVISFFIAIPFYLSNYQVTLLNSLFEAISGITGTGFSVFKNIKYLDPTLILWRSSSQWIGGLYFLFFLILIFSNKQFDYKMNALTYSGDGSTNSETNIKDFLLKIFITSYL